MDDLVLRPWHEVDLEYLGVHRALQTAEGGRAVPSYVARSHDRRLWTLLDQREDDSPLFVLIVGDSSTGKTRTAYEATRREHEHWNVAFPRDARELSAFLRQRAHDETILWLDEAHRYFGGPGGPEAARDMRMLLKSRRQMLAVATIWRAELDRLAPQTRSELNRIAVEVQVPESFSATDLERARRIARRDSQVAEALSGARQRGLVIQALACGPDLVDRYEHGDNTYGKAVVAAAMDLRRVAALPLLGRDILQNAAAGYLDAAARADPPANWFDEGLRWACTPVRNAVAALSKARYQPGVGSPDGYVLADYLDQYGHQTRKSAIVPGSVWNALLAHCAGGTEGRRLGAQAHRRSLYRIAAEFWRVSDLRPRDRETAQLADLLEHSGHPDHAEHWLRLAASGGEWHPRRRLVDFLISQNRANDAIDYIRSLADAGDREAAESLSRLLTTNGKPVPGSGLPTTLTDEEIAELDDPDRLDEVAGKLRYELTQLDERHRGLPPGRPGLYRLINLLIKHGRGADAVAELRVAFDHGHTGLGSVIARQLSDMDRVDEAISTVAGLSFENDANAPSTLAELVYAHGRVDDAVALLGDYALKFDQSLDELAEFLVRSHRVDDLLRFLADASAHGHDHATLRLAELLEQRGAPEQAATILRAAVDSGHDGFAVRLGRLLLEAGDVAAARSLIEDRIDQGDTQSCFSLALLFRLSDATPAALAVLRDEARRGSEAGWQALFWFCLSRDDTPGAEEALRIGSDNGNPTADEIVRQSDAAPERLADYLRVKRHAASEAECEFRQSLGLQLERVGRIDEALEHLEAAARSYRRSDISVYFCKACQHHRPDRQIQVLRELAHAGEEEDICHLAATMSQVGVLQETTDHLHARHPEPDQLDLTIMFHLESVANGPEAGLAVLQRAADAKDRWARRVLAPLNRRRQLGTYEYPTTLSSPEHVTASIRALRPQARAGDISAQTKLAGVLEAASRFDEAAMWRRSVADADPTSGQRELAGFLERTGDHAGSHTARLAAAQAGDYIAMRQIARYCEDVRLTAEASSWWRNAVECGDLRDTLHATGPDRWVWSDGAGGGGEDSGLAHWHEARGELDEALWMRQRAGEDPAFDELIQFLRRSGQDKDADTLLAFGIEPGGRTAEPW